MQCARAFYSGLGFHEESRQLRHPRGGPAVIRPATAADRATLHELYSAFFSECPTSDYYGATLEEELGEVDEILDAGLAFVADEDGDDRRLRARAAQAGHARRPHRPLRPAGGEAEGCGDGARRRGGGALWPRWARRTSRSPSTWGMRPRGRPTPRGASATRHLTLVAEIEELAASPRIDSGDRAELWFRPRSDRRHRRCHARGRAVHPAPDGTLGGDGRRAAAQRLDRGLRRGRRPRAGAPPPARPRAVRPDGRRDPLDRRRARAGRPLPALRARADRGRVPVRPSSTTGSWRRATRSPSERIRRWSRG